MSILKPGGHSLAPPTNSRSFMTPESFKGRKNKPCNPRRKFPSCKCNSEHLAVIGELSCAEVDLPPPLNLHHQSSGNNL